MEAQISLHWRKNDISISITLCLCGLVVQKNKPQRHEGAKHYEDIAAMKNQ